ncbi:MAG: sigma factor-like helix-turn-helix DNA-binding protein [Pseudomonadota bacterium]|nr:sigma factor-like helix-turn-helix DNA-binding protein [Pseudomonadota bacterium]
MEAIELTARAFKLLFQAGAKNSLDATFLVLSGFSGIGGVGVKTVSESQAAVFIFISKVENASENEVQLMIDPRDEYLSSTMGNLVEAFPAVVELYLSKTKGKSLNRDRDILYKRFGLEGSTKYTLEDLGTFYDVTRERIRQIEAKSIKELDKTLLGELKTKNWRLCPKIYTAYKSLKSELSNFEWLVRKDDIDKVFSNLFGETPDNAYLDLFMEVLGYVKLSQSILGFRGSMCESWSLAKKYNKKEIESVFVALDHIYDSPKAVPIFDLIVSAKKYNKNNISNDSIMIALSATTDVEREDDKVLVKFSRLRSASDKAFRVLDSKRKPMHFSKITQEINFLEGSKGSITETNLKNQLVADNRFSPIGRSGEWGLSEWDNMNNLTIVQAIEKVLHESGKPLSFADIKKHVSELRPDASENSLRTYLCDQQIFSRVGKSLFALSTWRLEVAKSQPRKVRVTPREFNDAIISAMKGKNPIDLPELISAIELSTGLSAISARQKLLSTTALEITSVKGRRCKSVYCGSFDELVIDIKKEKILLKDRVQNEIRSILFDKPNIPVIKGALYNEVSKIIKCNHSTFYQYLGGMNDIRQYKDGNLYYAIYDHVENVEKIEIRTSKYAHDNKTKEILERPLSLLTIENVDIALFELGLIFESSLKEFLEKQKAEQVFNVSSKDMSKLVNMIECVVREGVVTKGHHLSTLREERNSRAHGKPPSKEEREELFNKAHYISDLFVRYICFFREKCK